MICKYALKAMKKWFRINLLESLLIVNQIRDLSAYGVVVRNTSPLKEDLMFTL